MCNYHSHVDCHSSVVNTWALHLGHSSWGFWQVVSVMYLSTSKQMWVLYLQIVGDSFLQHMSQHSLPSVFFLCCVMYIASSWINWQADRDFEFCLKLVIFSESKYCVEINCVHIHCSLNFFLGVNFTTGPWTAPCIIKYELLHMPLYQSQIKCEKKCNVFVTFVILSIEYCCVFWYMEQGFILRSDRFIHFVGSAN